MSGAPAKRQAVRKLIAAGLSQTRACAALATSRSSLAYVPRARNDEALVAAIEKVHKRKPRWGYKRVHAKLRREGHIVNRKRVLRLWRELGFTLPARRPRKRLRSGESVPGKAEYANHVWTYDFIFDATAGGRMLKVLTVVDEHARQALAATVGRSLTSAGVREELERLFSAHGRPAVLRLRQRTRVRRLRAHRVAREGRRRHLPHRTRQALAERLRRVLQCPSPRRVPQHGGVLEPAARSRADRGVAHRVQQRAPAQLAGLPDAG